MSSEFTFRAAKHIVPQGIFRHCGMLREISAFGGNQVADKLHKIRQYVKLHKDRQIAMFAPN